MNHLELLLAGTAVGAIGAAISVALTAQYSHKVSRRLSQAKVSVRIQFADGTEQTLVQHASATGPELAAVRAVLKDLHPA